MKRKISLKKLLIYVIIVIVLILASYLFVSSRDIKLNINNESIWDTDGQSDKEVSAELQAKRDAAVIKYNEYIEKGLSFKAEGDAGNFDSYQKAIDNFLLASEVGEDKFWIPYLNIANTYKAMADYKNAIKNYDKALELSKYGEADIYLSKIEIYLFAYNAQPSEVMEMYEDAITKVPQNTKIMGQYAKYLFDNKEYDRSLYFYNILLSKFPDFESYKNRVTELNQILNK